ncbi:HAD-like domain-containing protein [Pilobolus umbonatus]|nr:HAD-like domain-containing protein [Pilobolus umbonatus]
MVHIEVFSDFDGTLCLHDTGLLLIDDERSMGPVRRRELEHGILDGTICYRDAIQEMWDSVRLTEEEAWNEHLQHCELDPGVEAFTDYCRENKFPITVVSSGLVPVVGRMISHFLGDKAKDIQLVANGGIIEDRSWHIQWRDDSDYGHDKSKALLDARAVAPKDSIFVFCGDGVSDISAARHADILFARKDCDLEFYCVREHIPFIPFTSFTEIQATLQKIVDSPGDYVM